MNKNFPVERLDEITGNPENFSLIERVPPTQAGVEFPFSLIDVDADETLETLIFLDTETTGLDSSDVIIELGLVKVSYAPRLGQLVSIDAVSSIYEDPHRPIPAKITELTGITDEMVKGQSINADEVAKWFADDPLVIAHNASFDRPMFERRFEQLSDLRWGCTFREIDWRAMGYSNSKLDFLLYSQGYFYEGHRAAIDCLATAWLLHCHSQALGQLMSSSSGRSCIVQAVGTPFAAKDTLRARRYWWDSQGRFWHTQVTESALDEEKTFLDSLTGYDSAQANIIFQDSRSRFKG